MGDLTEHFSRAEFLCPCCGDERMGSRFMDRLELLRIRYGHPLGIVEGGGYRCVLRNGSPTGPHTEGVAADLVAPREDMHDLLLLAFGLGFKGIGAKQKGGKWQLHVDDAEEIPSVRPRPWFWTY